MIGSYVMDDCIKNNEKILKKMLIKRTQEKFNIFSLDFYGIAAFWPKHYYYEILIIETGDVV